MGPSSAPSRVECPNGALSLPKAACAFHNDRAVLYKGRRGEEPPGSGMTQFAQLIASAYKLSLLYWLGTGRQYHTFTMLNAHVRRHRRYCRAVASAPQGATDVHSVSPGNFASLHSTH